MRLITRLIAAAVFAGIPLATSAYPTKPNA